MEAEEVNSEEKLSPSVPLSPGEEQRARRKSTRYEKKLAAYGPKAPEVLHTLRRIPSGERILWDDIDIDVGVDVEGEENNSVCSDDSAKSTKEKDLSHIQEIKNLISAFFSDFEGSTVDLLSGMLLVMTFHDYREDLTGNTLEPGSPDWCSGRYYMKFAAAAYGNMLACLKMRKKFFQFWWGDITRVAPDPNSPIPGKKKKAGFVAIPPKGDKPVVFEHTGISPEDFICGRWGAGVARGGSEFLPGYYLCVDHNSSSVVLGLRGSSNLNDALTDMVGHYERYRDGAVHKGMLHMTKNLLEKLREPILETLGKFPDYGFVVCGHSLGAGITSLFTLVFHDLYPEIPIHGYAYACPCTMDKILSEYCEDFLTTFVNGDDCVSRISLGSLDELKITMQHFLEASGNSLGSRLFHVTKQLTGIQSSKLASLFRVSKERAKATVADYKAEDRMAHLYPPGKIYHMFKNDENELVGELSHYSKFGHVVISGTMFTDHMPHIYEKALKKLADPFLEVSKRYHKRFLRQYGSKWVQKQNTLIVSLNPLYKNSSSVEEIVQRAKNQNIANLVRGIHIFDQFHPLLRFYDVQDISVSFVPDLALPQKKLGSSAEVKQSSPLACNSFVSPVESKEEKSEEFFDVGDYHELAQDSIVQLPEDFVPKFPDADLADSATENLSSERELGEISVSKTIKIKERGNGEGGSDEDEDEFYDCEDFDDLIELIAPPKSASDLLEILNGDSLIISNGLKQQQVNGIEPKLEPLEAQEISFEDLLEFQISLFKQEQQLKEKESVLAVRELELIERERKLEQREQALLVNSSHNLRESPKKSKNKKSRRSSLSLFNLNKKK